MSIKQNIIVKFLFLFIIIIVLLFPVPSRCFLPESSPANENIPVFLDHWSYPVIEYFVTEGILNINLETKPITRNDIKNSLLKVKNQFLNKTLPLDAEEYQLLTSLYEEFLSYEGEHLINTPKTFYSSNYTTLKEEGKIGNITQKEADTWDYSAYFYTVLWTNFGKHIAMEEQLNALRRKNTGRNDTLGTRAWKGFRGTTPIALFNLSFPHISINAGRSSNWLGPGRYGTLLVSNNYPYFDENRVQQGRRL